VPLLLGRKETLKQNMIGVWIRALPGSSIMDTLKRPDGQGMKPFDGSDIPMKSEQYLDSRSLNLHVSGFSISKL
jgi:hypothetical protein